METKENNVFEEIIAPVTPLMEQEADNLNPPPIFLQGLKEPVVGQICR